MLTDKSYKIGKKLVQILLPAFASLYFVLGLPSTDQVVGVTAIITTFLGVCLAISSILYEKSNAAYDGIFIVHTNEDGRKLFSLEIDKDPDEMEEKGSISFKIASPNLTQEV